MNTIPTKNSPEKELILQGLKHHIIEIIDNLSLFYLGKLVVKMVFNATFNNISVISWPSVLLVDVTGVPGENHRHAASH
jgi:hypothetical protein